MTEKYNNGQIRSKYRIANTTVHVRLSVILTETILLVITNKVLLTVCP